MRRYSLVLLLLPLFLGACSAGREPHLVWESAGSTRAQSLGEAGLDLQPIEPGRDGAPWGDSADATFRLLRTSVAEQPHVHDDHDLTVVILRGRGVLTVAGREHDAGPGDILHIGRGLPHWFRPDPAEPVIALAIFSPRLDTPDTRPIDHADWYTPRRDRTGVRPRLAAAPLRYPLLI